LVASAALLLELTLPTVGCCGALCGALHPAQLHAENRQCSDGSLAAVDAAWQSDADAPELAEQLAKVWRNMMGLLTFVLLHLAPAAAFMPLLFACAVIA